MAHIARNRVMELSTSTGSGSFTVAGSIAGNRAFSSVCSVADTFWGYIEGVDASNVPTGEWEDGLYTYSALNTIVRTTVRDSSNGGAAVNFSAGNKIVAMGVFAPQDATSKTEWRTLLGAAAIGANTDITSLTGLTTAISGTSLGNKVQPITASVASNALTITLNPTTLDFRSATLGSGTVNTRQAAAAISVVVSSGSTLGTQSAALSRLAVYAIDNAGTIELAVINAQGATALGEDGVVSTTAEGGAGAADSLTVMYSTTARASVPYRFVGFVESTQATAGTWATAPSLIQGAGGVVYPTSCAAVRAVQASTSGTAIDFTGIPPWATQIQLTLSGVSLSGTDSLQVQIGDAGGVETSGYLGAAGAIQNAGSSTTANFTTGFGVLSGAAANVIHGTMTLTLMDAATNLWASAHAVGWSSSAITGHGGGSKSLSATLDRVRLTTNGANTFDAGNVGLVYQ